MATSRSDKFIPSSTTHLLKQMGNLSSPAEMLTTPIEKDNKGVKKETRPGFSYFGLENLDIEIEDAIA